ncbi:hypothetical protein Ptr902_10680 [Pyrenophora tritici-repentis]|nr:hypothetical protein Ptr902_10680 [Pyrenophora tritici-repentis]
MKLLIVLAGLLGIAMAMPTEQNQNGILIPVEMEKRQDSIPCGAVSTLSTCDYIGRCQRSARCDTNSSNKGHLFSSI